MPMLPPTRLEYREYELPDSFPVLVLTPQNGSPVRPLPVSAPQDGSPARTAPLLHFHNCIEIGLCHCGGHVLSFESRTYPLKPGDFFVLSPYSMHYVNHCGEDRPGCCEYLYLKPDVLLRDLYALDIPDEMCWYKNADVPFLFSAAEHSDVYRLLVLLLSEYRRQRENYRYIVKGLAQALMAQLTRALSPLGAPADEKYRSLSMLLPALRQLHFHPEQPLELARLAAECSLSASALRALFTAQLGESPVAYLRDIRLKKACGLLYSTELSVLEISMECGFSSLTYFYRAFRSCYHTSPGKWREQNRTIQKKKVVHAPLSRTLASAAATRIGKESLYES